MPTSDGPSRFPVFVAPPHANHQRSPGYVPGRVAPVRSPPPAKAPPPPPLKPHGPPPERRATFNLSEENQRRERAQNLQQRKNTFICCGVSVGAFFLTLILIFSLSNGDVLDGQYYQLVVEIVLIFERYLFIYPPDCVCHLCILGYSCLISYLLLTGYICRELSRPRPVP